MARIYLSPPHLGEDERLLLLDPLASGTPPPLDSHQDAVDQRFQTESRAPSARPSRGRTPIWRIRGPKERT